MYSTQLRKDELNNSTCAMYTRSSDRKFLGLYLQSMQNPYIFRQFVKQKVKIGTMTCRDTAVMNQPSEIQFKV